MSLLSVVLQKTKKDGSEEVEKCLEDLLPKLKNLTERIEVLSGSLQQYINDTHVNFTATKSLEQLNYKNRKVNIDTEYAKCVEEVNKFPNEFEKLENFKESWSHVNKAYHTFNDLSIAAKGKNILDRADHEFMRYNYSEAILTIKNFKMQLAGLNFDENMSKALDNLNDQAENQLALYIAHLSSEWEDLFTWSEKHALNFITYSLSVEQSDPTLLQKVLKTLYVTDRLEAELKLFSHFFVNQLLHNVVLHNCDIFTEDHNGAIVFNIKIGLKDSTSPNCQTIFNNLTAIFEFLHSMLGSQYEGEKSFIEVLSVLIKQKFFNKIIENCIRNNLPSCNSSYEHYKNIVVELDVFNKFLIDLKFIEANNSPLNKFIDDTECVLYNKKCDKLLYDVRKLLSESISYGTAEVGSVNINENDSTSSEELWDIEKPIFLPKCVISQNVKNIMSLITEHLEESTKLPEKYSKQLVAYIKDIAVMYQCVVQEKFKVNLEACPSDIAIFFNNCFYLAHGLVGPPWCNILPRALADHLNIILLDSIQDLRVLGLEKMSLFLQTKKHNIVHSIESSDTSPWTQETFEHLDCSINKALAEMKRLKSAWLHVLPSRMYELSMCTLIQVLVQVVLERVFCNTKPIDEDLIFMLAERLEDTVVEVATLFEDPIQLESKVNSWNKFIKLPQLLKAQLLEISDLWVEKRDSFKSYTCEEVRQIVKMRFPDDKYRYEILKTIQ
ncbi:hypothetical protein K1T71_011915 [Dendrolimus kikuchii]|uniref:Uncharacterized protein n=1 Tax=Dendrolimus kikuchii TaxID=765133 RepID=A0ACC1CMV7_9NEOP|nr:hypothetical protein K1T71_011915 [Dendrolimus kikuchii]